VGRRNRRQSRHSDATAVPVNAAVIDAADHGDPGAVPVDHSESVAPSFAEPPATFAGGSGGNRGQGRPESGLSHTREQRLLARSIREGWWTGDRWATGATPEEIRDRLSNGSATVRDVALSTALAGMRVDDARVRQRAVTNVVAMERQNQADQLSEEADPAAGGLHSHLHIHAGTSDPKDILHGIGERVRQRRLEMERAAAESTEAVVGSAE
jgi:hypothetical protein